jgi:hypothetical protein
VPPPPQQQPPFQSQPQQAQQPWLQAPPPPDQRQLAYQQAAPPVQQQPLYAPAQQWQQPQQQAPPPQQQPQMQFDMTQQMTAEQYAALTPDQQMAYWQQYQAYAAQYQQYQQPQQPAAASAAMAQQQPYSPFEPAVCLQPLLARLVTVGILRICTTRPSLHHISWRQYTQGDARYQKPTILGPKAGGGAYEPAAGPLSFHFQPGGDADAANKRKNLPDWLRAEIEKRQLKAAGALGWPTTTLPLATHSRQAFASPCQWVPIAA